MEVLRIEHIGQFLRDIYFGKKQGQLHFSNAKTQKYLFFQAGKLVYARTNSPDELLGKVLFRLGKINEDIHNRINEFIVPKKSIGQVLIENDLVTHEDIKAGLTYQMREITLNLFPFFGKGFSFQEKTQLDDETFEASISIPVLIEDGIRRMKYDEHLQNYMQEATIYPKGKEFYFRLTEDEKEIFENISGEAKAAELVEPHKNDLGAFWKSLYLFYCLNLIDIKGLGEPGISQTEEPAYDDPEGRVQEVVELSGKIAAMDYYQILGVEKEATAVDIKKAYFQLARKYHPDLYDRMLPQSIKEKIDDVFDSLTKSYQTLSQENSRENYDSKLQSSKTSSVKEKDKLGEVKFRQGKTLYNQARFEEAIVLLEEAVRIQNSKANYFLLLAMAQAKSKIYKRDAVKSFQRAIKLDPWSPDAYYGLGQLYKNEGMPTMAAKQFKKALDVDPDNRAAKKELNQIYPESQKKGLKDMLTNLDLKDIFKKK